MAQLVARAVRDCEVACSSQVAPTIKHEHYGLVFLYNEIMIKRPKYDSRLKVAIAMNLAIIFFEIIGFMFALKNLGWSSFIYYTQDSNALALIAAILFICTAMWRAQGRRNKRLEKVTYMLKYIAAVSVTITFVVVITILSWTTNYGLWRLLTQNSMLYHHTICPILCIVSFLWCEKYNYQKKHAWVGISFTIIYAIVTIFLNLIGELVGPYPFLMVYRQPWWASVLWCVIILGGAYIFARLLRFGQRKIQR